MKDVTKIVTLIAAVFFCSELLLAQTWKPADPEATPEAIALMQRLQQLQQKGIMYGHQDDLLYGFDWWGEKDRSERMIFYHKIQKIRRFFLNGRIHIFSTKSWFSSMC